MIQIKLHKNEIKLLKESMEANSFFNYETRLSERILKKLDKALNMPNVVRSAKCHNCKHSSAGFKIAGKTHHQCNHPKHEEGFKSGELSAWDTLQEWYNSCESHELKK